VRCFTWSCCRDAKVALFTGAAIIYIEPEPVAVKRGSRVQYFSIMARLREVSG
jgi:hypothetical protein